MIQNSKFDHLLDQLKNLDRVSVAFSGGVDSSFLLAASKLALGDKAVGITIDSLALPRYELNDAISIAQMIGVRHIIVKSDNIEEEVKRNPVDRCYFCKKTEFSDLLRG
jgi:pyridinium-3,5-biscarboxylic acid mononucleotide sulfurtransferase